MIKAEETVNGRSECLEISWLHPVQAWKERQERELCGEEKESGKFIRVHDERKDCEHGIRGLGTKQWKWVI